MPDQAAPKAVIVPTAPQATVPEQAKLPPSRIIKEERDARPELPRGQDGLATGHDDGGSPGLRAAARCRSRC